MKIKFSPKLTKRIAFVFLGITVFAGMFWYVNTYIYKFLAANPIVTVNFSPGTIQAAPDGEFNVNVIMSGQKASAAEFYIEYDTSVIEYAKEYNPNGTGFSQTSNYFESPLIETVSAGSNATKKQLKLAIVSLKTPSTGAVQFTLKFRAKAAGTGKITMLPTTKLAGVDGANNPVYFDRNSQTGSVTVTVETSGGDPGPTSTIAPTGIVPTTPDGGGTTDRVSVNMSQASVNAGVNEEFTVGVEVEGQTVSGTELVITYDSGIVQYATEYDQNGTGFSQPAKYFEDPLIERVTDVAGKKQLKIALISLSDSTSKGPFRMNLRFKGIDQGTTPITIDQSATKVSGVDSKNNAVYFILDVDTPQTMATIGTGGGQPTTGPQPTSSLSPGPTQPGGGDGPGSGNVTMNMKVKFQGMPQGPRDGTESIDIQVIVLSEDRQTRGEVMVPFRHDGNGIWSGSARTDLNISKNYSVYLKGEKHLRKRICSSAPRESIPGGYRCASDVSFGPLSQIQFTTGANELDFSNIVLLAGDIPVQNGIVDAVDYSFIRQNFGSQREDLLARGDLNYDGIIDTQDYSLILAALAFKYDEE